MCEIPRLATASADHARPTVAYYWMNGTVCSLAVVERWRLLVITK